MSKEEGNNPEAPAQGETSPGKKDGDIYENRGTKKIVRLITVMAYMFSVSFVAIVLSAYYLFLWEPPNPRLIHRAHLMAEPRVEFLIGDPPSDLDHPLNDHHRPSLNKSRLNETREGKIESRILGLVGAVYSTNDEDDPAMTDDDSLLRLRHSLMQNLRREMANERSNDERRSENGSGKSGISTGKNHESVIDASQPIHLVSFSREEKANNVGRIKTKPGPVTSTENFVKPIDEDHSVKIIDHFGSRKIDSFETNGPVTSTEGSFVKPVDEDHSVKIIDPSGSRKIDPFETNPGPVTSTEGSFVKPVDEDHSVKIIDPSGSRKIDPFETNPGPVTTTEGSFAKPIDENHSVKIIDPFETNPGPVTSTEGSFAKSIDEDHSVKIIDHFGVVANESIVISAGKLENSAVQERTNGSSAGKKTDDSRRANIYESAEAAAFKQVGHDRRSKNTGGTMRMYDRESSVNDGSTSNDSLEEKAEEERTGSVRSLPTGSSWEESKVRKKKKKRPESGKEKKLAINYEDTQQEKTTARAAVMEKIEEHPAKENSTWNTLTMLTRITETESSTTTVSSSSSSSSFVTTFDHAKTDTAPKTAEGET